MFIHRAQLVLRIAYAGAPLSGKTETLKALVASLHGPSAGLTVFSPFAARGRTLYFDWAQYQGGTSFAGPLQCQLTSVPGQATLHRRRRALVEAADVVVFVVDSQPDQLEANRRSLAELHPWLGRGDLPPVGIVYQVNKRDLAGALPLDEIRAGLGLGSEVEIHPSSAVHGEGVRVCFIAAVRACIRRAEELRSLHRLAEGEPEVMTGEQLLQQLRGAEGEAEIEILPAAGEPLAAPDAARQAAQAPHARAAQASHDKVPQASYPNAPQAPSANAPRAATAAVPAAASILAPAAAAGAGNGHRKRPAVMPYSDWLADGSGDGPAPDATAAAAPLAPGPLASVAPPNGAPVTGPAPGRAPAAAATASPPPATMLPMTPPPPASPARRRAVMPMADWMRELAGRPVAVAAPVATKAPLAPLAPIVPMAPVAAVPASAVPPAAAAANGQPAAPAALASSAQAAPSAKAAPSAPPPTVPAAAAAPPSPPSSPPHPAAAPREPQRGTPAPPPVRVTQPVAQVQAPAAPVAPMIAVAPAALASPAAPAAAAASAASAELPAPWLLGREATLLEVWPLAIWQEALRAAGSRAEPPRAVGETLQARIGAGWQARAWGVLPSLDAARAEFKRLVSWLMRLGDVVSTWRCVLLAGSPRGWCVWQVVRQELTFDLLLRQSLEQDLLSKDAVQVLARVATDYVTAAQDFALRGVELPIHLKTLAHENRATVYSAFLPPAPVPVPARDPLTVLAQELRPIVPPHLLGPLNVTEALRELELLSEGRPHIIPTVELLQSLLIGE